MELYVKPGKYVAAVSGGVDSMALLDMLARQPGLELVAAHFDHGIRPDSAEDRKLVQSVAAHYGVAFVYEEGKLGPQTSEAAARNARYAFLRRVQAERGAQAIITAHHQDDLIETALINMLRGTGPRGLGMRSTAAIIRPLLHVPKTALLAYAQQHGLAWREDSTNADERYLRNYLRRNIMAKLAPHERRKLADHIAVAAALQAAIDRELGPHVRGPELDRDWFAQLPYAVSAEALAAWLRRHHIQFDRKTIHRLTVFAKTAAPHKQSDIDAAHVLVAGKNHITLTPRRTKG